MNSLTPVSFLKGREQAPRRSPPREPGRRSVRSWSAADEALLGEKYSLGGLSACAGLFPGRSDAAIHSRANTLGFHAPRGRKERRRFAKPDDETIQRRWPELVGRGAVLRLAVELGVPRFWLSQRALKLGLTLPHRKEPPWSAAEDALMAQAPLHDPRRAARFFEARGFRRTATAILVRAKRLDISRRATHEDFSAHGAARVLGVNDKTVTGWILAGELAAIKGEDMRLPQQGGSSWAITPAELRRYVLDNLGRVDLRKVEKFAFVALIAGDSDAKAIRAAGVRAETKGPAL